MSDDFYEHLIILMQYLIIHSYNNAQMDVNKYHLNYDN